MNYRDAPHTITVPAGKHPHGVITVLSHLVNFRNHQSYKKFLAELAAGIALSLTLWLIFGGWGFIAGTILYLSRQLLLALVIEILVYYIVKVCRLEK